MFYDNQTAIEKGYLAAAFRFELSKVGVPAIRERMLSSLVMEFIKDQFRHCKTILALVAGRQLLEMTGIGTAVDEDPGIMLAEGADAATITSAFIDAIAAHRHLSRDSDPPLI